MKKKEKEVVEKEEVVEEIVEELSEVQLLEKKVEDLQAQLAIVKNEYAKAYADTENTRKRLNNEFEQSKKYRIQSFALDVLPVIDNLERALSQQNIENEGLKKGLEMIYQQLTYALSKEGVEVIDAINQPFDPNFHQALMTEKKEDVESNQVIEVLQKGYKLKDRILRAAMVKVSE